MDLLIQELEWERRSSMEEKKFQYVDCYSNSHEITLTPEDFEDLKIELIDRYGFLPQSAENLFAISKLKKTAGDLGIAKILGDGSGGLIEFNKDHKVNTDTTNGNC